LNEYLAMISTSFKSKFGLDWLYLAFNKATASYILILLLCLFRAQYVMAQETLVFSTLPDGVHTKLSEIIIREAYEKIGYDIAVLRLPGKRSLLEVSTGKVDGELRRLNDLHKTYPNLIKIPISFENLALNAFTKNKDIVIKDTDSLSHYDKGIIRGGRMSETLVGNSTNVLRANNFEQLFKMLNSGRVDLVIANYYVGLNLINSLKLNNIQALQPPLVKVELYHYLHNKNKQLVPLITRSLHEMITSGRVDKITKKFRLDVINGKYNQGITLCTNISPPYQHEVNGELTGSVIEVANCIFNKQGINHNYRIVPWVRCEHEVKEGINEGYLSDIPSAPLSSQMTASNPLALAKWYWYYTDTAPNAGPNANVGAVIGSMEERWLINNGYEVSNSVTNIEQLPKMLLHKRINGFISDENLQLHIEEVDFSSFKKKFIRYQPLSVYFSDKYSARNEGFVNNFNAYIHGCQQNKIELSKADLNAIKNTIKKIKLFTSQPIIISAIKDQNKRHINLNQEDIYRLDDKWRDDQSNKSKLLINKILVNRLSKYLKKIVSESNGLYSEIFVMDNKGLIVGLNELTTDYWQGDEDKFKKPFGSESNSVFIDDIEFDESSKKFQSQVSITILDPQTHNQIGVITVGIDIEYAHSLKKDI